MCKPFSILSLSTTLDFACMFSYFLLLLLHSFFNYLSPALASRYEMQAFPNVLTVLPFPILYFLPKGPYSLLWHQLPWLCNCSFKLCLQMWSLFNSLLTLYDASISVCLKINSPYLPENYSNAHIIDNNYILFKLALIKQIFNTRHLCGAKNSPVTIWVQKDSKNI